MKQLAGILVLVSVLAVGCGTGDGAQKDTSFHTSGSAEADQRAEQRIIKQQQISGGGGDEKGILGGENIRKTLFVRLGGQEGVDAIVGDFVSRALADPRVNWQRVGVERGGILGIGGKSAEWSATPESIAKVKKHISQFITLATGGPIKYEGGEMKNVHAGMKITNAEFDASVGAFKASLDAVGIPTEEQKEVLAIVESTRPQIVEQR